MRKYLDVERLTSKVSAPVADARSATRSIGRAAESQAQLNIALTMVAVAALLVAIIAVRSEGTR